MDLASCTETLRARVGADCGLNATLKFDCGADGVVYIDGKSTPNTVSNANTEADCSIGISLADLHAMLSGELEPTTGFMMGKLKVAGDMGVALRLRRVL
jgi:putative sterol carrier protein